MPYDNPKPTKRAIMTAIRIVALLFCSNQLVRLKPNGTNSKMFPRTSKPPDLPHPKIRK